MREIDDFRSGCRVVLGDESGRRYSDSMVDMGLREALNRYRHYCPNKGTVKQRILSVEGNSMELPALDPGIEILTVRDEFENWLSFAEYRTADRVYIRIYERPDFPREGSSLTLELSAPHTIRGLDGANVTTIPIVHELTVCKGAAGLAMRIRAHSVTEVFGKRPEDRAALMEQAAQMIAEFSEDLSRIQPAVHDPLPRGGFPI